MSFNLDTATAGDSEMQHLDYAYATSLVRTFLNDSTLVLIIRGRKYTPSFEFNVGHHRLQVQSVQTEVDAGYEGEEQVVLIEAKNRLQNNVIIRQLYYPFRQWQQKTSKRVIPIFFEKSKEVFLLWQFEFDNVEDYNSIKLAKSGRFRIVK